MELGDYPVPHLFELGVAYPVRADIDGAHIGARRIGEFSTGISVEEITEWSENRVLAFRVLENPPALRELSPYAHFHAPHVVGYLDTGDTRFELIPLPNGHTRIVERTSHTIRLDPVPYWLPIARWLVHTNNARVLAYIKDTAEGATDRAAVSDQHRAAM